MICKYFITVCLLHSFNFWYQDTDLSRKTCIYKSDSFSLSKSIILKVL